MVSKSMENLYEIFNKQYINSLNKNVLEMHRLFPEYFIENYKKTHNITAMMAASSMKNKNKKSQKRPGKIQKKNIKKQPKLPTNIQLENLLKNVRIQ